MINISRVVFPQTPGYVLHTTSLLPGAYFPSLTLAGHPLSPGALLLQIFRFVDVEEGSGGTRRWRQGGTLLNFNWGQCFAKVKVSGVQNGGLIPY